MRSIKRLFEGAQKKCKIISSLHAQSWTRTRRATLTVNLLPFTERFELSVNCLWDRGNINVTQELKSMFQTSIKGSCKQYVKIGSVFTSSLCPGTLRSLCCTSERWFCFFSVCRWKERIMFDVEGEIQGRVNIYKANLSAKSRFFLVKSYWVNIGCILKRMCGLKVEMLMNMNADFTGKYMITRWILGLLSETSVECFFWWSLGGRGGFE